LIQTDQSRQQLVEIAKNNFIEGNVIPKFSLKDLQDSRCFTSLMFYMGLLTIDDSMPGLSRLRIPNYSIRTSYWEYIEELTRERNREVLIDLSILTKSMYLLTYHNDPKPFIDYISQNIVSRLSNRDLENFDEKYLKIILLNNLFYNSYYIPLSETEVTFGYTDIYLQRSRKYPDIPNEWILEIKYIKKSDRKNAALLKSKRKEAGEQLERYRHSHLFKDRTDVRYLTIIFIGKDKTEITELL
jgi:hypothetical protein